HLGHRLAVIERDHDVGRLDVAVDDALLVRVLDRWQTGTNSSRRSRGVGRLSSQYWVIGTPWTSSMTKYGRPASVAPPSKTRAILTWSIRARACRSASKRARTCFESMPGLITLRATLRWTG